MTSILIVDDNPDNIRLLANILTPYNYEIDYALNGQEAVEMAVHDIFDLILMDVNMPIMNGYDTCQLIKQNESNTKTPILFVTANTDEESIQKAFDAGGVDYITKPIKTVEVVARVQTHLNLKDAMDQLNHQNRILEQKVHERTIEVEQTRDVTIHSLVALMERRDYDTGLHIIRTQNYMHLLATTLAENPKYSEKLTPLVIDQITKSAALHDVGKVGIRDNILLNPGKLTEKEYLEMKHHPTYGYDALKQAEENLCGNSFLSHAMDIAYCHHERWDGSGYPRNLSGEDIPLAALMMSVADVYDALISKRVYKSPRSHEQAVQFILSGSGTQFAPDVIEAFLQVADGFDQIAKEHTEHITTKTLY